MMLKWLCDSRSLRWQPEKLGCRLLIDGWLFTVWRKAITVYRLSQCGIWQWRFKTVVHPYAALVDSLCHNKTWKIAILANFYTNNFAPFKPVFDQITRHIGNVDNISHWSVLVSPVNGRFVFFLFFFYHGRCRKIRFESQRNCNNRQQQ